MALNEVKYHCVSPRGEVIVKYGGRLDEAQIHLNMSAINEGEIKYIFHLKYFAVF